MSAIRAEVNYEGTEEGAEQLDGLLGRLDDLEAASKRAAGATDAFEDQLKAATSAQGSLGSATGHSSRAQDVFANTTRGAGIRVEVAKNQTAAFASSLGQLSSAMSGISPELDAMAGSIKAVSDGMNIAQQLPGPWGLALGALTTSFGLVRTAMDAFERQTEDAASAQRSFVNDIDAVTAALDSQVEAYRRLDAQRRVSAGFGSGAEYNTELERQAAHLRSLEAAREQLVANIAAERQNQQARVEASRGAAQLAAALRTSSEEAARNQTALRELDAQIESLRAGVAIAEDQASNTLLSELMSDAGEGERDARSPTKRKAANDNSLSMMGGDILGDLDELAERAAIVDAEQLANAEQKLSIENARIDAARELAEWQVQLASDEKDRLNEQWELEKKIREHNADAEEKAKQKRLADAREITSSIEGSLQLVASTYIDAFGAAIEGQKTLEEASLEATASLLKAIGEQMVAIGIREVLEGAANVVANPPVAATKIPMGIALIAAGAGLGVAGAAIPTQASAPPESPRSDADRGSGADGGTLVINYNSPIVTSGTGAQLSRQMRRQIDNGRDFATRRNAA